MIGLMVSGEGGKEVCVEEARIEMKEELEGGEAREEVCRSAAKVGRGGVAYEKECVIVWENTL